MKHNIKNWDWTKSIDIFTNILHPHLSLSQIHRYKCIFILQMIKRRSQTYGKMYCHFNYLSADAGIQCQFSIHQCFRHPPWNISLVFNWSMRIFLCFIRLLWCLNLELIWSTNCLWLTQSWPGFLSTITTAVQEPKCQSLWKTYF